jgi:uncharacterized OB-fold protein
MMFKWFGHVSYTPATRVAAFAEHLRAGRLVGSRCRACGARSFPPRADCEACLSGDFELVPVSGRARLHTWTRIVAPPRGFEDVAPYTLGLVDLAEGGRALATFGPTVPADAIAIGMELEIVPRIDEASEAIHVDYTLEAPGTSRPPAARSDHP